MSDSIIDEFIIEAKELIDVSEEAFLSLEGDGNSEEVYKLVFRCFHTLKGSAGMVGMMEMQSHMHLVEDRFQEFAAKHEQIVNHIDFFLSALDVGRQILKGESVSFNYSLTAEEAAADASAGSDDDFDLLRADLFEDLKGSVLVVGAGKKTSAPIIEALECKVSCIANAAGLKELVGTDSTLTLIVTEKYANEISTILGDAISNYSILVWSENSHEKYTNWTESYGVKLLKDLVRIYSEEKSLKYAYNKAVMLLMYQLSDLEPYLLENKKEHVLKTLKEEISYLMSVKAKLRER